MNTSPLLKTIAVLILRFNDFRIPYCLKSVNLTGQRNYFTASRAAGFLFSFDQMISISNLLLLN